MQTRKKAAIIALVLILIFIFIAILYPGILSPLNCNNTYATIDAELKNANYCTTDADCKVLPLGGKYVEFGCYHYINKNLDENKFYQEIDTYTEKCSNVFDDCVYGETPVCANGKCTGPKQN